MKLVAHFSEFGWKNHELVWKLLEVELTFM
jgi:hypothetical protein